TFLFGQVKSGSTVTASTISDSDSAVDVQQLDAGATFLATGPNSIDDVSFGTVNGTLQAQNLVGIDIVTLGSTGLIDQTSATGEINDLDITPLHGGYVTRGSADLTFLFGQVKSGSTVTASTISDSDSAVDVTQLDAGATFLATGPNSIDDVSFG